MEFRKLTAPARLRIAALLAGLGVLVLASGAAAVVYVYKNGFGSDGSFKEIDKLSGGDKCDATHSKDAKAMRIEMRGDIFCEYAPPVTGDAEQPDHEIVAEGKILRSSPENVRRHAYLGVRVRVGEGTYYEFRVNPKEKEYRLTREPVGGGAPLPISGTSNRIEPINEFNKLRLRITGSEVTAFINGNSVASYPDPNPGQVTGRKVSFGIGSTKRANPGPNGSITAIKVGVPTP
jgi:hypothetical protein